jgi:hypothetical protein
MFESGKLPQSISGRNKDKKWCTWTSNPWSDGRYGRIKNITQWNQVLPTSKSTVKEGIRAVKDIEYCFQNIESFSERRNSFLIYTILINDAWK